MVDDDPAANRRLVLAYIDVVIDRNDVARLDEFVAAGYRGHGFHADREALRSFLEWQAATASGWTIDVADVVAEGDRVAVRATASGTRSEEPPGVPYPSPEEGRVEWTTIYRVEGAKMAEAWVVSRDADT